MPAVPSADADTPSALETDAALPREGHEPTSEPKGAQDNPSEAHGPPPSRWSPRRSALFGGKSVLALVSALVLALTGYAWTSLESLGDGLTTADVIAGDGGTLPLDGPRDILLVGMDSRTDVQGNPLPGDVRNELLHVGGDGDENNTDTMILLHIPDDGSKAVAISLPRDSYVTVPGFGQHKINSAYPRAKATERRRLETEGGHTPQEIELRSNQAGAKTLIATVEQLTGRSIDNYAAINLLGFFEITKAVGGVEVCLKGPVDDPYTDLHLPVGRQTISGRDALGFVRQRHGLVRGDLDRIQRQQAFMAGLARKVLSAGTLTNPDRLTDLIEAVKKYIVLNEGWDILAFAQQLKGLAGGDIKFHTIPVISADLQTPSDGVAVEVDPQQVREFIDTLFGADEPSQPSPDDPERNAQIRVEVRNTTSVPGLAGRVSEALAGKGFTEGAVANGVARSTTLVRHPPGEQANARRVAEALGGQAETAPDPALQPGNVTVLLGADYPTEGRLGTDSGGQEQSRPPETEDSASGNTGPEAPAQGRAGGEDPITAGGIPCVN
jgi:LCP family protein required for cell wall assembly